MGNVFGFTKDFLRDYLKIGEDEINSIVSDEEGLSFLLLWPLFESKCYNGYAKLEDIKNLTTFSFTPSPLLAEFIDYAKKFHDIFRDEPARWENLKQNQRHLDSLEEIYRRDIKDNSGEDFMKFGLYVIYRYRNNIFHGYKNLGEWNKFSTEIQMCLKMMILCLKEKEPKANENHS